MPTDAPLFIRPMEPILASQPFDHPGYMFQLKWDGIRLLAVHAGQGRTRLFTRQGRDRTGSFPDLASAVADMCGDTPAVLDGEAVVLRDGRPWFPDVLRRLVSAPTAQRAAALPAAYALFDVVHWGGTSMLDVPLEERSAHIEAMAHTDSVIPVTSVPGAGFKLFQLAEAHQWEGIIAKQCGSPYVPGGKSPLWQKVKRKLRHLFAVIGCTRRHGRAAALLLGAYRHRQLVYCGRAGTGLAVTEWDQLGRFLHHAPPLTAAGQWPTQLGGVEAHWVEPQLTVWIEFLEWTERMHVRHPVIAGFADARPHEAWV